MDLTLYNVCDDILREVCFCVDDSNIKNKELEVVKFLNSNSKYDSFFEKYKSYIDINKVNEYKYIMMLIIISSAYKENVHFLVNNKHDEIEDYLNEIDELDHKEIYKGFRNRTEQMLEYLRDYFDYIYSNYIYANDCMEYILKEGRLLNLLKINPFEIICYLDYVDPTHILKSERDIQDFIDIQENAITNLLEENELDDEEEIDVVDLQEKTIELVEEKFNYDEARIRNFYAYIFGNVYETMKVLSADGACDEEFYHKIIEYFEDGSIEVEDIIQRFYEDSEFFNEITEVFLTSNESIGEEDLILQRDLLKETDGIGILKKINPYYEEEEYVFKKIKESN